MNAVIASNHENLKMNFKFERVIQKAWPAYFIIIIII